MITEMLIEKVYANKEDVVEVRVKQEFYDVLKREFIKIPGVGEPRTVLGKPINIDNTTPYDYCLVKRS